MWIKCVLSILPSLSCSLPFLTLLLVPLVPSHLAFAVMPSVNTWFYSLKASACEWEKSIHHSQLAEFASCHHLQWSPFYHKTPSFVVLYACKVPLCLSLCCWMPSLAVVSKHWCAVQALMTVRGLAFESNRARRVSFFRVLHVCCQQEV